MAKFTITQKSGSATYTVSTGARGPAGNNGSDAEVTTANVLNAIKGAAADATRIGEEYMPLTTSALVVVDFRQVVATADGGTYFSDGGESSVSLIIPTNASHAISVGFTVSITRPIGAPAFALTHAGVTVNNSADIANLAEGGSARLIKVGTDEWDLIVATAGASTAADVSFSPTGNIAATNVQAALAELDGEKAAASSLGTAAAANLLDEDDMASNSAVAVPSQQSVKAYVDSNTPTVDNAAVNAAIVEDPASTLNASGQSTDGTKWNQQIHSMKRVLELVSGSGSSAPIRIAKMGDSLAQLGILCSSRDMPLAGSIGDWFPLAGGTGGYTAHNQGAKHSWWMSGKAWEFSIGAVWQLTRNAQSDGDMRGNKACIGYVKKPDGATFNLEYQANATGSWTSLATIDTASGDGTTYGAFAEYDLPVTYTNINYYRLRINNVTSGTGTGTPTFAMLFAGIYHSIGGGVIEINCLDDGGRTPANFLSTPDAMVDPLWPQLKPDLIINAWNDGPENWSDGGDFDLLYDRLKALYAATDFVLVGPNPMSDTATEAQNVLARAAMLDWAERNSETFFDNTPVFQTYARANSLGLMADTIHPSDYGRFLQMEALWKSMQLTANPIGFAIRNRTNDVLAEHVGATVPGNNAITLFTPLNIRNSIGLQMMRVKNGGYTNLWQIRPIAVSGTVDDLEVINQSNVRSCHFRGGASYFRGILPYSDGYNSLGSPLKRWRGIYGAAENWRVVTKTADYTIDSAVTAANRPYDRTILCDATSNNVTITLPPVSNLQDSENISLGRILTFKRIDASGFTVTIGGNASETIDGATTYSLASQYKSVTIQCDGTAWHVIASH